MADRWEGPRDRADQPAVAAGGFGAPPQGAAAADSRRYSSPTLSRIYQHMMHRVGSDHLPVPRINPDVIREYPDYLADGVAGASLDTPKSLWGVRGADACRWGDGGVGTAAGDSVSPTWMWGCM